MTGCKLWLRRQQWTHTKWRSWKKGRKTTNSVHRSVHAINKVERILAGWWFECHCVGNGEGAHRRECRAVYMGRKDSRGRMRDGRHSSCRLRQSVQSHTLWSSCLLIGRQQRLWVPAAQVNSSSWFPNHVKGAMTRFLIVPRKDELWRTNFAGRRSLLVGDTSRMNQLVVMLPSLESKALN